MKTSWAQVIGIILASMYTGVLSEILIPSQTNLEIIIWGVLALIGFMLIIFSNEESDE